MDVHGREVEGDAVGLEEAVREVGLLFPIRREARFGMVMIEAMACGTPVVALRGGRGVTPGGVHRPVRAAPPAAGHTDSALPLVRERLIGDGLRETIDDTVLALIERMGRENTGCGSEDHT